MADFKFKCYLELAIIFLIICNNKFVYIYI